MASIELDQVTIEFPIYNARGRSLTVELHGLAMDGAKLITGDTLYIDGGYHVMD